jgi:hypothetical protein
VALWNKRGHIGLEEYKCQCGFSLNSVSDNGSNANTGNKVAEHLMHCEFKSCHFKSDAKEESESEEEEDFENDGGNDEDEDEKKEPVTGVEEEEAIVIDELMSPQVVERKEIIIEEGIAFFY